MSIAMEVTMTLMTLTMRLTLANSCELSVVGVSLIGKRQRVCCWMHGVFAGDPLVQMKVSQVRGWSKKTKESGAVPVEEPRVILAEKELSNEWAYERKIREEGRPF